MENSLDLINSLRLYALTNHEWGNQIINLQLQIELAIAGGVTCIALKEDDLIDKKVLPLAKELREICEKLNVAFIIHDRIDIATKIKADGICISQDSPLTIEKINMKLEKAKQKMFIGVTVKNPQEAIEAQSNGADYIVARGVFQTINENPNPITTDTVREICSSVNLPVIASGGLNKKNISELAGIDIVGAGVKTSIFSSSNIKRECEEISSTLKYILS